MSIKKTCRGSLNLIFPSYLAVPGVAQAVLLVLGVAEGALAANGVRPRQRDVLLQQHGEDLVVVPVRRQDDGGHVHGGGILRVLDPLHQFLRQRQKNKSKSTSANCWRFPHCVNTGDRRQWRVWKTASAGG